MPRFASLNLTPPVEALTRLPRGLVLVGGPTGSGKTTTLAALVNAINLRDARHIITIEDPIECASRRPPPGPDIIVVGEMRDPETMPIAVAAGETGHLARLW